MRENEGEMKTNYYYKYQIAPEICYIFRDVKWETGANVKGGGKWIKSEEVMGEREKERRGIESASEALRNI